MTFIHLVYESFPQRTDKNTTNELTLILDSTKGSFYSKLCLFRFVHVSRLLNMKTEF